MEQAKSYPIGQLALAVTLLIPLTLYLAVHLGGGYLLLMATVITVVGSLILITQALNEIGLKFRNLQSIWPSVGLCIFMVIGFFITFKLMSLDTSFWYVYLTINLGIVAYIGYINVVQTGSVCLGIAITIWETLISFLVLVSLILLTNRRRENEN